MFSAWMRGGGNVLRPERNRTLIAVTISVLVHAVLLLMTLHQRFEPLAQPSRGGQEPLTVRLAPPVSPAARPQAALPPAQAAPAVPRPPKERRAKPLIRLPKRPRPARTTPDEAVPPLPPIASPQPAEPMDMMSMIQAARERRRAAEEAAARENAEARMADREPSRDDIAMANIRRSLQSGRNDRTGGVFQVVSKGVRTGAFIFRGWTPGQRNFPQQTFEVDAGPNGDVERALVRKMIELIRSHYDGDFNWDSHRLGRVVVKSARKEDSAELEAFLMKEFFSNEDVVRR